VRLEVDLIRKETNKQQARTPTARDEGCKAASKDHRLYSRRTSTQGRGGKLWALDGPWIDVVRQDCMEDVLQKVCVVKSEG
jgi:hypothetical protein